MAVSDILLLVPLILILPLLKFKNNDSRNIVIFIWFTIIFSIFAGFRSTLVPDTSAYIRIYGISFFDNAFYERGYILFQSLHKLIFGYNYVTFFMLITAINLTIIYYLSIKLKIKYPLVAVAVYASYYGIFNNFIVLRSGLASSFVLLSWAFFRENKIKSILFFIIAVSFHNSAILGVVGFVILSLDFKLGKREYIAIIVGFMFLGILGVDRIFYQMISPDTALFGKYYIYLENNVAWNPLHLGVQSAGLISIYLVMDSDHDDTEYMRYLNLYLVGFLIYSFASSLANGDRIFMIFNVLQFYLLAKVTEKYIDDNKINPVLYLILAYNSLIIYWVIISHI